MCRFLLWDVDAATGACAAQSLPSGVVTIAPAFEHPALPPEVAILLPGRDTNLTQLEADPRRFVGRAMGLFLSDPFLNVGLTIRQLRSAGVTWVAALPSACQHEADFRQYLREVDLDLGRELRVLRALSEAGFGTIAAVSSAEDAAAAAEHPPDAVLALPDLGSFVDGWPDLAARAELERAASHGLAPGVALLGLRRRGESADRLAAAVLRPRPLVG